MCPRTIDLNQVLRGMEVLMKHVLGDDIALNLKLNPELGAVRVDPVQVEQVLMNLIVNAKDAMGIGGEVVVETQDVDLDEAYARGHEEVTAGSYAMVSISDTGCGMDAATQARIFEPFFTTKGDHGGTGLGLSTVHGIVRQSGGHVSVYSEVGRGTTFRVYLPRVDSPAESLSPTPRSPLAESEVRETVLLVEDEEPVRQTVQRMLEGRGYRVLPVAGMSAALRLSREYRGAIDVLLTDVAMPGGMGPELADALRVERPSIHVLFMSGYAQSSPNLRKMMEKGFPLLEKPFSAERLHGEIRRLVEARA
jgi:CheY-like chemotaxis protein